MIPGGSRDPRIGTVLKDKWKVDARLGRGGVATVYACTHRNGAKVAIKMLNREVARNPDIRSRFLREGYAANAVSHPGVVRVLDDDATEEGQPFLVMDLLEGELVDERRMRKGGRLPVVEVLRIGDQVLDVLAAAHEKGIIHRDIKPENIFLTKEGTIKVLDFGIARMRQAASAELTATGMLLGTPEFMSPEQANGVQGEVDLLTDIWSTGATLFTLLSGEAVHAAANTTAAILAVVSQPARSLGSVARDVPRPIVEVIDKALAFDKRKRWQDARTMQLALAAAGRGVTTGSSSYAAALRRPQLDLPPPSSGSDDPTVAMDPVSAPTLVKGLGNKDILVNSDAITNPKPQPAPIIEDESTTVAERQPPVTAFPSTPRMGEKNEFKETKRSALRAEPEDAPTEVAHRPPSIDAQARRMTAPITVGAPGTASPDSPTMPQAPAPPGPSASQAPPDIRATRRMASAPPPGTPPPPDQSMGGFILRPRVKPSETPTGPALSRKPQGPRSWTGVIVAGAVGAVFLWLVIVIVLRVVLR